LKVWKGSAEAAGSLVRPVVTVGNFDGIHLGHQAILRTVVARARALSGAAVVYTFDPHPRKVLRPDSAPGLLTTLDQKVELLESHDIDALIVEPFTLDFARTDAETFIRECLHRRLRPVEVYVGYDFHFGRDRSGSMRLLTELGPRLGFAVTIIPEVTVDEGDVNSTRIRRLLADGLPELAARMLGRPYAVRGTIVRGDERGRTLGFPTANLHVPPHVLVPAYGVYAVRAHLGDSPAQPAVLNIGVRPTFGEARRTIEAHLLDWDGDCYGRWLELELVARLRGEQRFDGPEALRAAIAADVAHARRLLGATSGT